MGRVCVVKSCPSGRKLKNVKNYKPQSLSFFQPTMSPKLKNFFRQSKKFLFISVVLIFLVMVYHFTPEPYLDQYAARRIIDNNLEQSLKIEKGSGCSIPNPDPFSPEMTAFDKPRDPINCKNKDWVYCLRNKCRVHEYILSQYPKVQCKYRDILYHNDSKYTLGMPKTLHENGVYILQESDHVKVECRAQVTRGLAWKGNLAGLRLLNQVYTPADSKKYYNILIFGFDSVAKNYFIRKMPQSYKVLTQELNAVVLNGYNIVGDGTAHALIPMFTGYSELELPDIRDRIENLTYVDALPLIWYQLKEKGYDTAYIEDMPAIGTFQLRFTGFQRQPTDHYLRSFFLEAYKDRKDSQPYCIGELPIHTIMMNLTEQFMQKRTVPGFIFTFLGLLSHEDYNTLTLGDQDTANFLRRLKRDKVLDNTVLIVMGDHGPRFQNVRNTLQGKQEERLPMMSFVLPESFQNQHPEAVANLRANAEKLTTPFDIHATLLQIAGMEDKQVKINVAGSDLPRSMSLLKYIPANRSCSEAGIEPHWCACLKWYSVDRNNDMSLRVAMAFMDFINKLTASESELCLPRFLKSIEWVTRLSANPSVVTFIKSKDRDGYIGRFGPNTSQVRDIYQVKVTIGPGNGMYEASLIHDLDKDKITARLQDISRTNAYGEQPRCISDRRPDLNMYCYCKDTKAK